MDRQLREGVPAAAGLELRLHRPPSPPTRSGAGKKTGLVPQDVAAWNYGQIAQNLDKQNARLGARHLGPLSVQTQDACADGRLRRLRRPGQGAAPPIQLQVHHQEGPGQGQEEEGKKTIRLPLKKKAKPLMSNLGMEISFTDSPEASASQAILSTSAAQAAACVPAGPEAGRRGVLLLRLGRLDAAALPAAADRRAAAGRRRRLVGDTGGVGSPGDMNRVAAYAAPSLRHHGLRAQVREGLGRVVPGHLVDRHRVRVEPALADQLEHVGHQRCARAAGR